ncbi:MAG: Amuc_1099 family pilus-like system protein [Verrucomicrobiota bacterium]
MGSVLKKEKAFVLLAGAFFLAGAGMAWNRAQSGEYAFQEPSPKILSKTEVDAVVKKIPPWDARDHLLFVSRPLIYDFGEKKILPLDLSQKGEDGIAHAWKRKHGFSLKFARVAEQDADEDGFSNAEEYASQTDPWDPKSSPPAVAKLRLKRYQFVPFQFVFKGYIQNPEGDADYQINVEREGSVQTLMVKPGQKLTMKNGTVWMVGEFRQKIEKRNNPTTRIEQEYDESELDLHIDGLKELKMTLKKDEIKDSRESFVDFSAMIPGEEPVLGVFYGSEFSFRGEKYQLLEANEQRAIVKHVGSEELIEISALKEKKEPEKK